MTGAICCERLNSWLTRGWITRGRITAALAVSVLFAPLVLPILEPAALVRYMAVTDWNYRQKYLIAT